MTVIRLAASVHYPHYSTCNGIVWNWYLSRLVCAICWCRASSCWGVGLVATCMRGLRHSARLLACMSDAAADLVSKNGLHVPLPRLSGLPGDLQQRSGSLNVD
jgi:hypothetical protein